LITNLAACSLSLARCFSAGIKVFYPFNPDSATP
jgi:hypothetical protein